MAKILVVDDDAYLCSLIRDWLKGEHHEVDFVGDGIDATDLLKVSAYDLIVLDWDLPGKTGIEILRDFRKSGGQTPVIMLTAKSGFSDKELGFDHGVDDYMTKPFNIKELAARIRAILRRPAQMIAEVLSVGDVQLDPQKHKLTKAGVVVHLQPKDFALLEFLMRHPNNVFSADMLLARVWQADSDASSEGLRTAIKRIRKKLDDENSQDESNSIIQTIPRVGYKIRSD